MDLARELKKVMEHEGDSDTNYNWCTWNSPQRFGKETGRTGNWRMCQDSPNYNITKIGQNTEKSPGDLLSLRSSERPSANTGVENLQGVIIITLTVFHLKINVNMKYLWAVISIIIDCLEKKFNH